MHLKNVSAEAGWMFLTSLNPIPLIDTPTVPLLSHLCVLPLSLKHTHMHAHTSLLPCVRAGRLIDHAVGERQ